MKEKPVIYQVFTRLFGNKSRSVVPHGDITQNGCGKLNDFDHAVLRRIRQMGITHVWYTGIIRHATTTDYSAFGIPKQTPQVVKGKAGSPYAITDYYDVDPDIATDVGKRMEEFLDLVRRTHEEGMKVIIDFVPNHVAREYHSVCKPEMVRDLGADDNVDMHFSSNNNFYYCWGQPLDTSGLPDTEGEIYRECPAKATGNDHFDNHPNRNDWYETVKLNYGIDYCDAGGRSEHFSPIPDTWSKMTDILLFWASKGVDAFRCDMAEMVPSAFWHWATDKVKFAYPHVTFIGEVYAPGQYRRYIHAGFDYLYDKVGMYDCLRDVMCGRRKAADITRQWQVVDDIFPHMLYFLENHDEQRIASDFFAGDAQKGIPGMLVSTLLNTNPVMVYAGQEFGERGMDEEGFSGRDGRTTIFDYWMVDSLRRGYFDRRTLKKEQRSLQGIYTQILSLANNEVAIREGKLYDLMYVNPQMADKQYAFLRKADSQLVLVVVNFDEAETEVKVVIPSHAFEFLNIKEGHYHATDLLTDKQTELSLGCDKSLKLQLPASGGVALEVGSRRK
ncbi:MAG: alpha-amylase family protein [Prevotella sp.]|nr:alpha-amylase family protein [Prevotella sp.]